MIIIPILTFIGLSVAVYTMYKPAGGEPDSYQKWINEPNDLEIV